MPTTAPMSAAPSVGDNEPGADLERLRARKRKRSGNALECSTKIPGEFFYFSTRRANLDDNAFASDPFDDGDALGEQLEQGRFIFL